MKNLIILISSILTIIKPEKIVFVFKHTRHGVRSPFFDDSNGKTYTDVFGMRWEKSGILTGSGISHAFTLGMKGHKKYKSLQDAMTSYDQLRIKTTNTSRTIKTAKSFLEGMFPSLFVKNISKYFVDLFDEEEIGHLFLSEKYCPNVKLMKEYNKRHPAIQAMYKKINDTFGEELKILFKEKNYDFLFNFERVHHIVDTLISDYESYRNLTFLMKEYHILAKTLYQMCIEFRNVSLFNVETNATIANVAVVKTFPIIVKAMEDVINNKPNHIKILVYSGHDIMIAPMELYLRKIFGTPLVYPHYTSNLNLKLFQNETDPSKYYVDYYLYDDLIYRTSFENFKEKVLGGLWTDEQIKEFCNREVKLNEINSNFFILICVVIILFTSVISFGIFKYFKNKKRKNNKKKTLLENEGKELNLYDI